MQPDQDERGKQFRERYAEIMKGPAVFDMKKTPDYKKTLFRGTVEPNGVELSAEDIAIVADAGNLCFGGWCSVTKSFGRLAFSGAIYTD